MFNPGAGGWRASNGSRFSTVEEYRDYLFSDERLGPRMDIFVGLSLQQLAAAAEGYDVRHVVSYSEFLPERFKRDLEDAAARFPFVVLDENTDDGPSVRLWDLAAEIYGSSGQPFGHYRLDDDDLVPADYFAQMAPYIRRDNVGMMVTLGAGATALYDSGRYYNVRLCYAPMIAIGLLGVCQYDEYGILRKPVAGAHNHSDRKNPVIVDSRRMGFLWTRHVSQDSSLGWERSDREDMVDVILRYMDRYPPATAADGIAEAFPAAAQVFTRRDRPGTGAQQRFAEELVLSSVPTALAIDRIDVAFSLGVDVVCPEGRGENNVLVSFELSDGEGAPLIPSESGDLVAGTAIMVSSNPDIGFFCYLTVGSGTHRVRTAVRLPEGTHVTAMSVRRFRNETLDIRLRNVSIEEYGARSA